MRRSSFASSKPAQEATFVLAEEQCRTLERQSVDSAAGTSRPAGPASC